MVLVFTVSKMSQSFYQTWQFVHPCRFRFLAMSCHVVFFFYIQKLTHFSFNLYNFDIFVYRCRIFYRVLVIFLFHIKFAFMSYSCHVAALCLELSGLLFILGPLICFQSPFSKHSFIHAFYLLTIFFFFLFFFVFFEHVYFLHERIARWLQNMIELHTCFTQEKLLRWLKIVSMLKQD